MTSARFLLGVLAVWLLGAFLYPMNGLIHVLLVLAIIILVVDRASRTES